MTGLDADPSNTGKPFRSFSSCTINDRVTVRPRSLSNAGPGKGRPRARGGIRPRAPSRSARPFNHSFTDPTEVLPLSSGTPAQGLIPLPPDSGGRVLPTDPPTPQLGELRRPKRADLPHLFLVLRAREQPCSTCAPCVGEGSTAPTGRPDSALSRPPRRHQGGSSRR